MQAVRSVQKVELDNLERGQTLSIAVIENHTGHAYGTTGYELGIMSLAQTIEKHLNIVCTQRKGSLYLLTELERSDYAWQQTEQGVDRIRRNAGRLQTTDTTEFEDADKAVHENRSRVSDMLRRETAAMLKKAHREASLYRVNQTLGDDSTE